MHITQMPKVIDVSRWQGIINWPVVRKNIDAAMIKIGGSDDGFYMDGQAQRNLIEARSAGVPIGTYVFLGGVFSIQEEVQHIVSLFAQLGGFKKNEPFCLDWERRRSGLDEVGYMVGIVEGLTRRGFPPPLIYMNMNYVVTQNWKQLVARNCGLWVAAWGDNDAIPEEHEKPGIDDWRSWVLWQYTSSGSVPGIAGRVDHSLLNGDISDFKRIGLPHSIGMPGTPPPIALPTVPDAHVQTYTVVAGDTLSRIAGRYGRTWQELYALNRDRIANPNRIFPKQVIKVWSSRAGTTVKPTPTHDAKYHTVVNGENLSVLAARYGLSSWRTLYDMNRSKIGDNPNMLIPGMRLRLP